MSERTPSPSGSAPGYASKKCPECYEYIPLRLEVCPKCKTRVGPVNKHGMAERLTNYKAYAICILLWVVFALYIKWAFF